MNRPTKKSKKKLKGTWKQIKMKTQCSEILGCSKSNPKWWVLRRAGMAWSTGCGAKTMNTVTLKEIKKKKK